MNKFQFFKKAFLVTGFFGLAISVHAQLPLTYIEYDSLGTLVSIDTTSNQNFVVFGNSFPGGSIRVIDKLGTPIKQIVIPDYTIRSGRCTTDDGFIIGGDSGNVASVIKLDSMGNRQWKTEVNVHLDGHVSAITMNNSNEFYICVFNDSALYHDPAYFVRLDSSGTILCSTKLLENGFVSSNNAIEFSIDDNPIVLTTINPVKNTRVYKIDSLCGIIWSQSYYDTTGLAIGFTSMGITKAGLDSFIVTGTLQGDPNGDFPGLIYFINSMGDSLWSKTYFSVNGYRSLNLFKAVRLSTGEFFIIGNQDDYFGRSVILLIKTDSFGDTIWTQQISGRGIAVCKSMILDDLGYPLIIGYTQDSIYANPVPILIRVDHSISNEENLNSLDNFVAVNYFSGQFQIAGENLALFKILDLAGKLIFSQKIENKSTLLAPTLNHGIYIISVIDRNGRRFNKKFVLD